MPPLTKIAKLLRANLLGLIALFVALGGTAWALQANSVRSKHIVNGQVKAADLRANSVTSAKVGDGSLTGADINQATLGGIVQGRGRLLSNRIVFGAGPSGVTSKTLLSIPGLGMLQANCHTLGWSAVWVNATTRNIDAWSAPQAGSWEGGVKAPGDVVTVAEWNPGGAGRGSLALGRGNDPGPRTVATLDAFGFQGGSGAPCGFQVQGTVWTSG